MSEKLNPGMGIKPWQINLFERSFFTVTLATGTALMLWLLTSGQSQQTIQVVYFAIPVSVMLLVLCIEKLHPIERNWSQPRGDTAADLWSLSIVALAMEPLMTAIGPALAVLIVTSIAMPSAFSLFTGMPLWQEALLVILMIDFGKYWFHRASHHNAFLWRFHSSHHAVKRMYLINGFRLHPIYHMSTYMIAILPPMVLGASQEALIMHSVVLGIAGSFQHANIKLQHGPLNYIFSTNELHRWHHSSNIQEGNKNCGAIFSVWDILFGSYHLDLNGEPKNIGLHGEEFYPMNNYWKQLAVPFLWKKWMDEPMARKAALAKSANTNMNTATANSASQE